MTQETDTVLTQGDRIAGRYVIQKEIGRGGFGVVYLAIQEGVERQVAIKTLHKHKHNIPGYDFAASFRKEAQHTSRLKHPNTITVHDYGETNEGLLYLVMEYLEGETLYERMWRKKTIDAETTIHVGMQIAKSLAEAHDQGIIHGDLKPANIFLCHLYGENDFVKVLDFGITKLIGEVDPTGLGTPEYMPPEQFSGQPLLAASDVYSLGLIMFEMLVGQRPFEDKDTRELARKHLLQPLPPMPPNIEQSDLGYIIRRACAKDASSRFENGWVFFEALESINLKAQYDQYGLTFPEDITFLQDPTGEDELLEPEESGTHELFFNEPDLASFHSPDSAPKAVLTSGHHPHAQLTQTPFTGRHEERNHLNTLCIKALATNEDLTLLICGSAGSGKTRLALWLLQEADIPSNLLRASGTFRDGSPLPMEGIGEALCTILQFRHVDLKSLPLLQERLQTKLSRPLEEHEVRALTWLYAGSQTTAGPDFPHTIAALLRALAQRSPLLIHLDNIHWADNSTLLALKHLSTLPPTKSLILICTLRREVLPTRSSLGQNILSFAAQNPNTHILELPALNPKEMLVIVEDTFLTEAAHNSLEHPPEHQLLESIAWRSHGNPQYAIELIRHLFVSKYIIVEDNVARLDPKIHLESVIPPRIAGSLRLRLAQIEHRNTHGQHLLFVLTRFALLGMEVPRGLIVTALRVESRQTNNVADIVLNNLNNLLHTLLTEDILTSTDTSLNSPNQIPALLTFSQPHLRQILLERTLKTTQTTLLHHIAARAKQNYYSQKKSLALHAEDIHNHYTRAQAHNASVSLWIAATRETLCVNDLSSAIPLLERAWSIADSKPETQYASLRILINLSWLHLHTGALDQPETSRLIGMMLAQKLNDLHAEPELTYLCAHAALLGGHLHEAKELLSTTRTLLNALPNNQLQPSPPQNIPTHTPTANPSPSLHLLSLQPLPKQHLLGLVTLDEVIIEANFGRWDEIPKKLQNVQASFKQSAFLWGLARSVFTIGQLQLLAGRSQSAERSFAHSEELFAQTIPKLHAPLARVFKLHARSNNGFASNTHQILNALLKSSSITGDTTLSIHVRTLLAQWHIFLAQNSRALEQTSRALELARAQGPSFTLLNIMLLRARIFIENNNLKDALQTLKETLALLQTRPIPSAIAQFHLLMSRIQARRNRFADAEQWLSSCIDTCSSFGLQRLLCEANARIIMLQLALSPNPNLTELANKLHAAHLQAVRLEHPVPILLRAQEAIARLCFKQGHRDLAHTHARHALEGWKAVGDSQRSQSTQNLLDALATSPTPQQRPKS